MSKEIDFNNKNLLSIGSGINDDFVLNVDGICENHVQFISDGNRLIIKPNGIVMRGNKNISEEFIQLENIYKIKSKKEVLIGVYKKQSDCIQKLNIDDFNELFIGRDKNNHISLINKHISVNHAKIYRVNDGYRIQDINSTNFTYVNGIKISDTELKDGDIINVCNYNILLSNGLLHFKNTGNDIIFHLDHNSEDIHKIKGEEYPFFQRSPRLVNEYPTGEYEILPPPYRNEKPQINWLTVILSPLVMIFVSILSLVMTNGSISSLIFILPMSVVTIITTITTYVSQVKKHKKLQHLRLEKYTEYLKDISHELSEKSEKQYKTNLKNHPDINTCINISKNIERRLWERMVIEDDFLDTRIGMGEIPFTVDIQIPSRGIELEEDELSKEPDRIKESFSKIKNAAVTIPIFEAVTVGIFGERKSVIQATNNMLVQISTHHSYKDVKLVILCTEEEKDKWNWVRWLPHIWNDDKTSRYITSNSNEAFNLLKQFDELLKRRETNLKKDTYGNQKLTLPYFLFIITDKKLIENQKIMEYLTRNNPQMGIGALLLFDSISSLPQECQWFIECKRGMGVVYSKNNITNKQDFIIDKSYDNDYETFSRAMAPIREKSLTKNTQLQSSVTFMQGYNISHPDELNIRGNWAKSTPYKSLAAPIGVKASGDKFIFDIHEKAHGPHGLVAGTTGSGKSEILQSWILSMCLNYNPQEVSFVLIDFKGTGLAGALMTLPHISGIISNVDTGNIQRNLISLESEIQRRQMLLKDASTEDIQFKNVDQYQKAYKEGLVSKSISHLIIVIDEFAELKAQHPDFMSALVRAARVGRSLGIHLVLATQKPTGVVDEQIWSNSRFKWCLKVADESDSNEMIRRPDAAYINVPGRAYVQIGHDELFELIQSYWSGASYEKNKSDTDAIVPISFVELNGKRKKATVNSDLVKSNNSEEEISVIVKQINKVQKEFNIGVAEKIWQNELPKRLFLSDIKNTETFNELLTAPIGLIDDPYNQSQYPFNLNIGSDGHTLVYGAPSTGKTTLLQTLIYSLACSYTPDMLHMYIMDFGGWSMNIFKDLPHIGGIANDNEEEKINNLAKLLLSMLEERKKRFAFLGVNNIVTYREASKEQMPCIVLILDNFAPVLNIYPDLDAFFITLSREGGSYGIYLIMSANALNSISYRISQNFKQAIALQMIDRMDYIEIVGNTNGLEPSKVYGRGLVKGKLALEFQTALPMESISDTDLINKVKSACSEIRQKWVGELPPSIPVMPTIVTKSNFKNIPRGQVPIGLTLSDIEPIYFDSENNFAIISGIDKSGKTNLLKQFSGLFEEQNQREVYWFSESINMVKDWEDIIVVSDMDKTSNIIKKIYDIAENRKYGSNDIRTPIIILIDDIARICSELDNESQELLEGLIRSYRGLEIYIYVTGNALDIIRLYNQGNTIVYPLVNGNVSILLGGSFSDHDVFNANIGYSERDIELLEHCGYYMQKGRAIKFKSIYG